MDRPTRPPLRQTFFPFSLLVLTTPTPLANAAIQASLDAMWTSIVITNAKAAANTVWVGDASITVAGRNGIEIVEGSSKTLAINNLRQIYELQVPVVDAFQCYPEGIPVIVWDVAQIYLIASANTLVGGVLFPEVFV